ncbi:MAG: SH3 domain-containing protein, partial [Desulfobacterales bacterium]
MLHFSKTILTILTAVNIIFIFHPIEASAAKPREIGIVTTNRLNIRPEPGITKPPLKVIERGTKVYILGHTNGWVKIKHGTQVGYIRNLKRFIRIISLDIPPEKPTGNVDHDIKKFKKKAKDISKKIKKSKAQVLTFTRKEASIVSSLNDIDLSINNIRKQISAIKSELVSLEKGIEETNKLSMDLKKSVAIHEGYASRRLVALYKLSWLGKIHVLASAQSIFDLLQRQNTIERILTYDDNIRQNFLNNNARLQDLLAELNQQKS